MSAESHTKLFASITTSTVWGESSDTRVVWITMLAMADQYGRVAASLPGLARVANVTMKACEIAIKKFLAPDPHSRTPEHEGRRIEPIDGGWRLLNHGKYRNLVDEEHRRSKAADRQRRFREREKEKSGELDLSSNARGNAAVTESNDIAVPEAVPEAGTASIVKSSEDTNHVLEPTTKGRRLPRDWKLPIEWAREAGRILHELGSTNVVISTESEKFRDHFVSKAGAAGCKLDWLATWRNWVREAATRAMRSSGQSRQDQAKADALRMMREGSNHAGK